MSTSLSTEQQAELLALLQQRREQLSRQLSLHLHGESRAERAADVAGQDADDAPQRAPEREIAMALTDHERRALDAVSAALERMHGGRYGMCADCGVEIAFDRLHAEPWARRCIACETEFERRGRG